MAANTPRDAHLPGLDGLDEVCRIVGADPTDACLLHHRSNAVYLLPRARCIVRLAPDTPLRRERATTVIAVTRWLTTQPRADRGAATARRPASDRYWCRRDLLAMSTHQRPGHARRPRRASTPIARPPRPAVAGTALPAAAPPPRSTRPRFPAATPRTDPRGTGLADRTRRRTGRQVHRHPVPLGEGLVHADAHTENLVRVDDQWVLIDWDQTCIGPRELDLLTGLPDHFHEPRAGRRQFLATYGYDILDWPEWTLLRDITELHSLAAYIRLAASKPAAATELRHRLRSLRTGDTSAQWHAIS